MTWCPSRHPLRGPASNHDRALRPRLGRDAIEQIRMERLAGQIVGSVISAALDVRELVHERFSKVMLDIRAPRELVFVDDDEAMPKEGDRGQILVPAVEL